MKTTLNEIRAKSPCSSGWKKILAHLGKTKADDEPVSIITILDNNGLDDALWCLQAVKGRDREIRLYGVWCARQVQHLMTDPRSIAALDMSERFANGEATSDELAAAGAAAWAVVGDAEWDASRDASRAAAWTASRDESRDASRTAARAAAWAASRTASRTAQEKKLRELCAECH